MVAKYFISVDYGTKLITFASGMLDMIYFIDIRKGIFTCEVTKEGRIQNVFSERSYFFGNVMDICLDSFGAVWITRNPRYFEKLIL